jgi:saccharopine dehydrogenase (NAD+, L-lysine-forming)
MGRVVVRDLYETSPFEILVADYDAEGARRLAESYGSPRLSWAAADATDVPATARLLQDSFAVVNTVQYQHNVQVMQAALQAGCHYLDLGGLYHATLEQLGWHRAFLERDRLALLGIGASPGTTNVMARVLAERLPEIHELHVRVAAVDLANPEGPSTGLDWSYSIQTILEEATRPAAVLRGGEMVFVPALTRVEPEEFPPPLGLRTPALTLHSELATLPANLASKGLRECTFAIAFEEQLEEKLRFLSSIGINSLEPLRVGEVEVVPQQVLLAALRRLPRPPAPPGVPRQYEVLRVIARAGSAREVLDCHVTGIPQWSLGVEADTGCPPSIAVQMLHRGEITARGVLPPEVAVPPGPFFEALARRGMRLVEAGQAARQG